MRAIHKYKNHKHPESRRRIAQSLGYRISIWDIPHLIALCEKAGINLQDAPDKPLIADTETISV